MLFPTRELGKAPKCTGGHKRQAGNHSYTINKDLKPLDPFGTEKTKKVHRCTNSLQGLQKVMVKYFSYYLFLKY